MSKTYTPVGASRRLTDRNAPRLPGRLHHPRRPLPLRRPLPQPSRPTLDPTRPPPPNHRPHPKQQVRIRRRQPSQLRGSEWHVLWTLLCHSRISRCKSLRVHEPLAHRRGYGRGCRYRRRRRHTRPMCCGWEIRGSRRGTLCHGGCCCLHWGIDIVGARCVEAVSTTGNQTTATNFHRPTRHVRTFVIHCRGHCLCVGRLMASEQNEAYPAPCCGTR